MTVLKRISRRGWPARFSLSSALGLHAAHAQDKTYTMKMTLPTLNDPSYFYAKAYAAALEKDSGGRIKPEDFSLEPIGLDPAADRRHPVRRHPMRAHPLPKFFVGVDERFEVMAAPGLVDSMDHGQRVAADPAVQETDVWPRTPIKDCTGGRAVHERAVLGDRQESDPPLAQLQGQENPCSRLAVSNAGDRPARRDAGWRCTLGDVVPAIQARRRRGRSAAIVGVDAMHFQDAAKSRDRDRPARRLCDRRDQQAWYESLPADLQSSSTPTARQGAVGDRSGGERHRQQGAQGLERYRRRADQLAGRRAGEMMKTFSSVGADVSKTKPLLDEATRS